MSNINQAHNRRIEILKKELPICEMWECEFDKLIKEDKEFQNFSLNLKNFNLSNEIKPRSALYGGRVNAAKLYYKINYDEKIMHYDIRSLYPYCQKYGLYPVGHPLIINNNFHDINEYFGLINCSVFTPKKLLFPI
jgi:hypothetical protein